MKSKENIYEYFVVFNNPNYIIFLYIRGLTPLFTKFAKQGVSPFDRKSGLKQGQTLSTNKRGLSPFFSDPFFQMGDIKKLPCNFMKKWLFY